jgi:hypothetical protein
MFAGYASVCFSAENQTDKPGFYAEMGFGNDPSTLGGEMGLFMLSNEVLMMKGGLGFLLSENFKDVFVGTHLGMRLCVPGKISPFIGVGVFGGYTKKEFNADDDGIDNDGDGKIDEPGEKDTEIDDVIGTFYPEAGINIWSSPTSCLTLSGKYNYTSKGRENDFWSFNFGFMFLFQ